MSPLPQINTYTLFDCGLPDTIGYLKLSELSISKQMMLDAEQLRYSDKIFITPPLDIYINDSERTQTFQQTFDTYNVMLELYNKLGYQTASLPLTAVNERAAYILSKLEI
ncbi:AAA family ATPase [Flavobacterium bizetiae]|uniref:AAA family ATPase n=1 Tax=Flavobacterium bizetiae TaxID=2704140 RepID=UPI003757BB7A